MSSKARGPRWWQVYALLPLLVALFLLEMRLPFSEIGHEIAQIGILVIIFGLVHLWLHANASALRRMDMEEGKLRASRVVKIYSVPRELAKNLQNEDKLHHPMFKLPDHEIKGLLGNTFEMDNDETIPDSYGHTKNDVSKN
ncbi:MAG: hypothetical protein HY258_12215 [Chloroflexi bacterium]|nr:hypothetical protein [Chloroflexota bacterium]